MQVMLGHLFSGYSRISIFDYLEFFGIASQALRPGILLITD